MAEKQKNPTQSGSAKRPALAHLRVTENGLSEQTLAEHCRNAATIAASCLKDVGLEQSAFLAALLHDCGKAKQEFQSYLRKQDGQLRGSVIHTFQGCKYLLDRYHESEHLNRRAAAELLAFAVASHHGLLDCVGESGDLGLHYRQMKQGMGYEEALSTFFSEIAGEEEIDRLFDLSAGECEKRLSVLDRSFSDDSEYCFAVGTLARLLLSAVIEGDRRDTAQFMNCETFPAWPEDLGGIWEKQIIHFESKLSELSGETELNRARQKISDQCKSFAANPGGIYRLNVPTGSGKTLSSLRYALYHAKQQHKTRIIFTSPLLSILEQNAQVIRSCIADDSLILEHHSNVVPSQAESPEQLRQQELLAQTWDAPIILTTMVQLLNTLFSGKTTAIRRLHALCNSVIIIDEVQTVPAKLLSLFNVALRFLSLLCGATVVLCSATQPCLERAAHPLRDPPPNIVPPDPALWQVFARTKICPTNARRLEEMPELIRSLMEKTQSLLIVCNKKGEAKKLLEQTVDANWRSFHLSAGMCVQHRRDTIAELRKALKSGEKTLCISTQVIEAGVDISFQNVVRLSAGMDSVVQAAGRCNRNGESRTPQDVFLVNCTDEALGKLPEIQRGKAATLALLEEYERNPERFGCDLCSDAAIAYYYRSLYQSMEDGLQDFPLSDGRTLFDLLSLNTKYADERCQGLDAFFLWQAFRTAGAEFAVFDEDTVDVLAPYGRGKELIAELCAQNAQGDIRKRQALLKQAGPYSVSMYRAQLKMLEQRGAVVSICDGCALALQEDCYDEEVGLKQGKNENMYLEV